MRKTTRNIYSFPDPEARRRMFRIHVQEYSEAIQEQKKVSYIPTYLNIVCSRRKSQFCYWLPIFLRLGGKSLETSKNGEPKKNGNLPLRLLLHQWVQKRLETL